MNVAYIEQLGEAEIGAGLSPLCQDLFVQCVNAHRNITKDCKEAARDNITFLTKRYDPK